MDQSHVGASGDALLSTPAQEHAFQAGVIAIALLLLILVAAELLGRTPAKWRTADPHAVVALLLATAWVIARALSDIGSSSSLQLFLGLLVALGILVGTAWRPARLLAGVTAIVVVPEFAMVVASAANSSTWTVGEAVFWGSLMAGLTLTALLVAFSVTAAAMRLARVIRAPRPTS